MAGTTEFAATFTGQSGFSVDMGETKNFSINTEETIILQNGRDIDPYEGEYEVTPKVTAQTLNTRDRLMEDDLTVKAIPYYEVSNAHGGSTIIIGGDI